MSMFAHPPSDGNGNSSGSALEPLDDVLRKLKGASPSGSRAHQYAAHCPAHDDSDKSFAAGIGDNGHVCLRCFTGCEIGDILAALDMTPRDLFADNEGQPFTPSAAPAVHPHDPPEVWEERCAAWAANFDGTPSVRAKLAAALNIPESAFASFSGLGARADHERGACFTFPERNAQGRITGAGLRFMNRDKRSDTGSKRGLTLPIGWDDHTKPLYIVEGPSDVLAMIAAGCCAVGRPGVAGGVKLLAELIRTQVPKDRRVIFMGENDKEKPSKTNPNILVSPGRDEALKAARKLAAEVPDHTIEFAMPPNNDDKDIRGWATRLIMDGCQWCEIESRLNAFLKPSVVKVRHEGSAEEPPVGGTPTTNVSGRGTSESAQDDTDIANGRRFAGDHGTNVRYVADWGEWVVFDGCRWVVDRAKTRVEPLAKETADRMVREAVAGVARATEHAADQTGQALRAAKAALKAAEAVLWHAKATSDMRAIGRMLHAARSEPAICVPKGGKLFDTRRDLLNCPNGTVELRTGTLREHRREDYITRLCPTRFDPAAPSTGYVTFLDRVFTGQPNVAKYVREVSGYVVTGEVSDQSLQIFNGEGSNGKNVLTDLWKATLGESEYAHTAAAELLVNERSERHPTEKTGLRGARLVICSETGEDGQLDEVKMKSLTGGDTVTARYMRGDFFEFEPTHKLVLLTNNRPRVKGTDHGVWRRIRLVPFAVKFWTQTDKQLHPNATYRDELKADPGLRDRLIADESEGVLADMVVHAAQFYAAGGALTPPAEVSIATAEYRTDQDLIGQYLQLVEPDVNGKVPGGLFYKHFLAWWLAQGHPANRAPSATKFGTAAKAKFAHNKPSGVVYHIRLPGGSEPLPGVSNAAQDGTDARGKSASDPPEDAPSAPGNSESASDPPGGYGAQPPQPEGSEGSGQFQDKRSRAPVSPHLYPQNGSDPPNPPVEGVFVEQPFDPNEITEMEF